ncbi:hypothetical protein OQY15_10655 [Pedobacter sp. MC2016-15]|nr:hypothetical protein [Pedobacter sp. MC2016-15]MCX2479551.1 hypothetical protein [Pedobacter sp. MC2016-15]
MITGIHVKVLSPIHCFVRVFPVFSDWSLRGRFEFTTGIAPTYLFLT